MYSVAQSALLLNFQADQVDTSSSSTYQLASNSKKDYPHINQIAVF